MHKLIAFFVVAAVFAVIVGSSGSGSKDDSAGAPAVDTAPAAQQSKTSGVRQNIRRNGRDFCGSFSLHKLASMYHVKASLDAVSKAYADSIRGPDSSDPLHVLAQSACVDGLVK